MKVPLHVHNPWAAPHGCGGPDGSRLAGGGRAPRPLHAAEAALRGRGRGLARRAAAAPLALLARLDALPLLNLEREVERPDGEVDGLGEHPAHLKGQIKLLPPFLVLN